MIPASDRSAIWWSLAAKVVGIALALSGAWILYALAMGAVHKLTSHPAWTDLAVDAIFVLPFALGGAGFLGWLAWRLWFRWNAATARWIVGFLLAMVLMWILGWVENRLNPSNAPAQRPFQVGTVVALIIGAILYRQFSRAIIRLAGLDDPKDEYGNPLGHTSRIETFCTLLGLSVWMAAESFDAGILPRQPREWQDALRLFGPVILGWATYRITMWRLKPPTRGAVPLGGFEVIPIPPAASGGAIQREPTHPSA